jgi:hypothetical protein
MSARGNFAPKLDFSSHTTPIKLPKTGVQDTLCKKHKVHLMRNENSESAEVRLLLEGRHLEFIESQRRQQPKIPPRIEIIRQLIEKAIVSASSEGKVA